VSVAAFRTRRLARVGAVLAPPPAPGGRAELWEAQGVHRLALGLLIGLGIAVVHNGLAGETGPTLVLVAEMLVVVAVMVVNHGGATLIAARALAGSLPVLAALLMILSGYGLRDVAVLLLPASMILCGLLLEPRTLAALAALNIGAAILVSSFEAAGWMPLTAARAAGWRATLDVCVILVLTSAGVALVSRQLRRSLDGAREKEGELRRSEERYRALIELAADAIFVGRTDGTITEVNRRACELTAWSRESLVGMRMERLFPPDELARAPLRYESIGSTGAPVVVERELLRQDGARVPIEMSSRRMPDGSYQSIARDVSERRRAEQDRLALEARLRQAQKMEAVGRLAGGVAHDFNNLLTAITGSLTLAMRDVGEDSRARRWLNEVDAAAWRAASLTRQLLAFSRKQIIAPRVLDLREVVSGLRPMLARLIGEDVELLTTVPETACLVDVDQGQIEQVLLNLAANARDAMPFGGRLALDVAVARIDERFVQAHPDARAGNHAVLSVKDTGHGMTDEVRSRVFEPFFTTKPAGSGTGLGLAMVYGAVQQNRGWIEVDSAPGHGTMFRIFLPVAENAEAAAAAPGPEAGALRGTETVLLVEDEAPVREVMTEQLQSLGYRVLACPSGESALTSAHAHAGAIDLLVTDLVMPGMNGRELARRLEASRPGLKVVFTSGYGEEVVARHGVLEPGVRFVEKPYTLRALAQRLREALSA
jgi:two-component system cell cycle sensor histidine kinase/response regulator CckA